MADPCLAEVSLVYGDGNIAHGYHSDPDADCGRERLPFDVPECDCGWIGEMHVADVDALRQARDHVDDVEPTIWAFGGKRLPFSN